MLLGPLSLLALLAPRHSLNALSKRRREFSLRLVGLTVPTATHFLVKYQLRYRAQGLFHSKKHT